MDRFAYTLRRLAQVLPVAIGVTIVTFLLVHLVPGDPAATVLGQRATPQLIAQLHKEWGLDRSLPEQYWLFMQRLAHGDLGDSLLYGVPVREMIIERAPVTLWLLAYSTVLSMLIAVPARDGRGPPQGRGRRPDRARSSDRGTGHAGVLARDHADPAAGRAGLEGLPGRWLRRGCVGTPGEHVPARADGGDRHGSAADTQPAREPARGARVRLRHDGPCQGAARAPGARPPRPA